MQGLGKSTNGGLNWGLALPLSHPRSVQERKGPPKRVSSLHLSPAPTPDSHTLRRADPGKRPKLALEVGFRPFGQGISGNTCS